MTVVIILVITVWVDASKIKDELTGIDAKMGIASTKSTTSTFSNVAGAEGGGVINMMT